MQPTEFMQPTEIALIFLKEEELRLRDVHGKQSKLKTCMDKTTSWLARVRNCALISLPVVLLKHSSVISQVPTKIRQGLAHPYLIMVPLRVCVTCQAVIWAFECYLKSTKPKYNDYLENRIAYYLQEKQPDYAPQHALSAALLIKNNKTLKDTRLKEIKPHYRTYCMQKKEALKSGVMHPTAGLEFGQTIVYDDVRQEWLETVFKEHYAKYCLEETQRLLNVDSPKDQLKKQSHHAMVFAHAIDCPYPSFESIRDTCIQAARPQYMADCQARIASFLKAHTPSEAMAFAQNIHFANIQSDVVQAAENACDAYHQEAEALRDAYHHGLAEEILHTIDTAPDTFPDWLNALNNAQREGMQIKNEQRHNELFVKITDVCWKKVSRLRQRDSHSALKMMIR